MKIICDKEIFKTQIAASQRASGMSASGRSKQSYGCYLCKDCGNYHIYTKKGKKKKHQIPGIGIRSQELHIDIDKVDDNNKISIPANIINKLNN